MGVSGAVLLGDRRKPTDAGWRKLAGVRGVGKTVGVSGGSVRVVCDGVGGDTSAGGSNGGGVGTDDTTDLLLVLGGTVGDVSRGMDAGDTSGSPPVGDTRRPSPTPVAAYGS